MLRKNRKKHITFSVPIKKESGNDNNKTITYKINFVDTYRFLQSKLSDLVCKLSDIDNKDAKHAWAEIWSGQNVVLLDLKIVGWIIDVKNAMEYLISQSMINRNFSINVLLLWKGVYDYEYMDSRERFN